MELLAAVDGFVGGSGEQGFEVGEPRIHVVDDEATLRTVLRAVMSEAGYQVQVSDSAEAALEALEQQACDVLLVDKNLPGINGIDLSVQVRKKKLARHCIMITGYPSARSLIDALNAGIEGYLLKPFERLDDAVRLVIDVLQDSRRTPRIPGWQMYQHLVESCSTLKARSVAVLSQRGHRESWLRRLPSSDVFAHTDLGLSALADRTPELVAADDLEVLDQLMHRAQTACACFVGTALSFEQGQRLMRQGGVIAVDPATLAAGGAG